jgi:hypothetical protein
VFQGRAGLVLQVFFPKSENNFEANFSRVEVLHSVFTSRSPPKKSATSSILEKFDLKSLSDSRKKTSRLKSALSYSTTFLLVQNKGFENFLKFLCFEVFKSWGLGHEANLKLAKGRPDRAAQLGKSH